MSYDLYMFDKDGNECELLEEHNERQGTYELGGTPTARMNITYNYAQHFLKYLGEKGIRTIYGMTGVESANVLAKAIAEMPAEGPDRDYWADTVGNARSALVSCLKLAEACPEGVWAGD